MAPQDTKHEGSLIKLLNMPFGLQNRKQAEFIEDFFWYISPHLWTSVLTDSGTAAVGDVASGILTLTPSDGSVGDNDEAYTHTTNALMLFANNNPLVAEALVQFTEAATNKANAFFGIADSIGANTLVDDGGGIKTSFSGAAIYKVDGGTVWKTVSSLGSTQTITTSTTTAGGSAYQCLRIEAKPISSTILELAYFVDGLQLLNAAVPGRPQPIKDYVTYTSAVAMQIGAGVKNGSTDQQTLLIDYIAWAQHR